MEQSIEIFLLNKKRGLQYFIVILSFLLILLPFHNFVSYGEKYNYCNPSLRFPEKPDFHRILFPMCIKDNNKTDS